MDQIDKAILESLFIGARISNAELAARVELTPGTCLRRVKKLEEAGIIQGYSAKMDLKKLGLTISSLIFIQLTSTNASDVIEFENAIAGISGILSCSVLTGRHDYLLKVVAKDLQAYEVFLKSEIANIPNIVGAESLIVLNEVDMNFSPWFTVLG